MGQGFFKTREGSLGQAPPSRPQASQGRGSLGTFGGIVKHFPQHLQCQMAPLPHQWGPVAPYPQGCLDEGSKLTWINQNFNGTTRSIDFAL